MCLDAGFLPQVKYEVRHWLSVVSLVAQGMGVALVPRSLAKSGLAGAAFVPIREGKTLSETWCVWRAAGISPPTLDQFLAAARFYVGRMETSSAPEGGREEGKTRRRRRLSST